MAPNAPRCMCEEHRSRAIALCSSNEYNGAIHAVPRTFVTYEGTWIAGPFEHFHAAQEWLRAIPVDLTCSQPYAAPVVPRGYKRAPKNLAVSRKAPKS